MEGGAEQIYIIQDAIPDELCKMKWNTEEFHFFLPPFSPADRFYSCAPSRLPQDVLVCIALR